MTRSLIGLHCEGHHLLFSCASSCNACPAPPCMLLCIGIDATERLRCRCVSLQRICDDVPAFADTSVFLVLGVTRKFFNCVAFAGRKPRVPLAGGSSTAGFTCSASRPVHHAKTLGMSLMVTPDPLSLCTAEPASPTPRKPRTLHPSSQACCGASRPAWWCSCWGMPSSAPG